MSEGMRPRAAAYISPTHAAEQLGCHRTTVLAAIRRGDLEAFQNGRLVRIPHEAWDAYLERHTRSRRPG